ncbi:RagB/SusD family nutrient uptake outer membrane protein [Sinomicrobium kalidii]|uniref:RagB/SusD family nutrient uptake outer membrane protein n=1 Tax=Sinomicrobium kalidii TaxID=2900738 RepID=UPI001E3B5F29|nr:RagB/SusD family nutrient uptake outer membrane protein [Sinomicrobium kalidii]UGU17901.1 RagB/SusD family nutrient uptake outer membrane protein [Sinomicrobium kalidii]
MNKRNMTKCFFVSLAGLVLLGSCTNLDEEIYSEVTPDNFYNTDEEFVSALGEAYQRLDWWVDHNRLLALQEVTTDAMVVPTRGTDWDDGGRLRRLHRHQWDYNEPRLDHTWTYLYQGISTANRLLYQFEQLGMENIDQYTAELRGLRALFYWQLLDVFGNVPLVTEFDVPAGYSPENNSRSEIFAFIESECLDIQQSLSREVGGSFYGRVNYYTVKALLAKLYLNAEVYTGTSMWAKAEAACDAIIDDGKYSLAGNYYDNFITGNQGSPEFIFAIPYDGVFFKGFKYHRISLHYESQKTYNLTVQPWNGFTTLEAFYNSYSDNDIRKNNFLVGPQYSSSGERLIDNAADANDPDGPPITFTPEINELGPNALRQAGARIGKWEIAMGTMTDLDNDFPVFRYADILLMKAEARFRQGETGGEALDLVNRIRIRAGLENDLFTELTPENLLAERGRELFAELHRRTDLIRFGRFGDAWWEKEATSSEHLNLFPIPRPQLDANSNLKQNPGY